MPAAKYRRRSQRNRRREGTAKFIAPAAPDPTAFNVLTLSGAGTATVNGVYNFNTASGQWDGPNGNILGLSGGVFLILDGGPDTYSVTVTGPIPPQTGWTVTTGTAPAPTIAYTA